MSNPRVIEQKAIARIVSEETVAARVATTEVKLALVAMQGLPGKDGGTGPAGPEGPPGAAASFYTHSQEIPRNMWTISHGMGKNPSICVVDSAGSIVQGDIRYIDLNSVTITFSAPFSGKAYLN